MTPEPLLVGEITEESERLLLLWRTNFAVAKAFEHAWGLVREKFKLVGPYRRRLPS